MSDEIPQFTVGELVKAGTLDKPLDGNHGGVHPKGEDFVESGIPFVMASDMVNGRIDLDGCKFISLEQARSLRKGFSKTGDVLLSHKATIGRTALVGELDAEYIMLTPQVTYYRIKDKTRLNNRYLKYYFDSREFQDTLNLWAGGGSTRSYLGITGQLKLPIRVPSIDVQKSIVNMLAPIDDKIELNRQMNETLEQMAQALFKSWFVDFDPVIDNALDVGNPIPEALAVKAEQRKQLRATAVKDEAEAPTLPDDIRSLFPSEFEFTEEMGWMPKGWEVVKSGEIIDVRDGTHDSPKKVDDGYPLVTSRHITTGTLKLEDTYNISHDDFDQVNKRSKVSSGDTLLTMIGTVGIPYLVLQPEVNFAIKNVGLFKTSGCPAYKYYFYLLLQSPQMQNYLEARKAGTTQKYLSLKSLRSIEFIQPPSTLLDEFNEIVEPLFLKFIHTVESSAHLSKTRDTLLPKLISGELQIPEAEKLTAEALN